MILETFTGLSHTTEVMWESLFFVERFPCCGQEVAIDSKVRYHPGGLMREDPNNENNSKGHTRKGLGSKWQMKFVG